MIHCRGLKPALHAGNKVTEMFSENPQNPVLTKHVSCRKAGQLRYGKLTSSKLGSSVSIPGRCVVAPWKRTVLTKGGIAKKSKPQTGD